MSSFNKVILVGRLGSDPETRTFDGGSSICQFSIATTKKWNDKNTNEKKEKTQWHRIVTRGRLAEISQQYLTKGKEVLIEGELDYSESEKDGKKTYFTNINCFNMQMFSGNNQQEAQAPVQNQSNDSGIDNLPF